MKERAAGEQDLTVMNPSTATGSAAAMQDIHDIYPPLALKEPVNWLLICLIIAAAVLAAAGVFFFVLRRKKIQPLPAIPPQQTALAELAEARSFLVEGKSLIYTERVSQILRRYIENRFAVRSTRQTTSEFLSTVTHTNRARQSELSNHIDSLKRCLQLCDLAKYAHKMSAKEELESLESEVRFFIEATGEMEENK